jgi:hypothetical protein
MKYLRLSLSVSLLTMFLAPTAVAGEMPCPVNAPASPSAAGDILIPGVAYTDAATGIALSLVQSVLSLF